MKKVISMLLALVMCLSLCACGKSNDVELTLENYSTYLNVSSILLFTGEDWLLKPADSANSISCNSQAETKITVTGASTNYDYNNVVITFKVTATYNTFSGFEKTEDVVSTEELTVSCDIGGGGTGRVVVFKGRDKSYQIEENTAKIEWEVVSISGTVTRIG